MAEPVIFRGRRDHLEVLLTSGHGFETIKRALKSKLDANRHFFEGSNASVSISDDCLSVEQRDELAGMLENDYQISLKKIEVAPESAEQEIAERKRAAKAGRLRKSESTLFVYETLRSGRRIAYDGDVVILGDVNSGAEVVASGSIIVMGSLRGIAHAGAQGDDGAIISALRMMAKQFRIGAHIAISHDGEAAGDAPEVARVLDNEIELAPVRALYV